MTTYQLVSTIHPISYVLGSPDLNNIILSIVVALFTCHYAVVFWVVLITVVVFYCWQYYGHRKKLQVINREDDLEALNRSALRIARQVATETGTLMAGNICNSTVYKRGDSVAQEKTKAIFKVGRY